MRRQIFGLIAAVLFRIVLAPGVSAQIPDAEAHIVLESGDGAAIQGALVALLDPGHRVVREGVSTTGGSASFRLPPGSYRVRVRRIGYLPFLSDTLSVPRAGKFMLRVESPRVLLATMVVPSRSKCGPIDGDEKKLGALWNEIAKALRTAQLSSQDFSGIGRAFIYHTRAGIEGRNAVSDTTFLPLGNNRPFRMRDAAVLAVEGYVVGDEHTGWTYYGPDESALLSDQFAATHCFQVVRDRKRAGHVGIEFKPVEGRPVSDVAGVLWVHESSAELSELTFRFVNAGVLDEFQPGGFTRFRRVPSGAWIVHSWALRGPVLKRVRGAYDSRLRLAGYVEDGGGVMQTQPDSPRR